MLSEILETPQTGDHLVNTQFTALLDTLVTVTTLLTHILIAPQTEKNPRALVNCNLKLYSSADASLYVPVLCKLCVLQNYVGAGNFVQYAKQNIDGTVEFSFMVSVASI